MIPAESVEAAARVIVRTVVDRSWESLLPSRQEWYRVQAHAALEAAAPHLVESAYELGWEDGREGNRNHMPPPATEHKDKGDRR